MADTPHRPALPRRRAVLRKDKGGQVQSVARALAILNALADDEQGLTLSEVAQTVGLAPSTAHRLLTSLQQDRFVRFDQERNAWQVGVQAFIVGNAFARSRDVVTLARPYMRQLMEDSGETVNLAVEDRGEAVYLAQIECRKLMRAIAKPGGRVLMHGSGIGKALLSALPRAKVDRIIQTHGLPQETERTLASAAALHRDLDAIRRRGYAIDDEENAIGLRCVAAVIYDEHAQPLAGISLSGPLARLTDARMPELGRHTARCAARITEELGGRLPD